MAVLTLLLLLAQQSTQPQKGNWFVGVAVIIGACALVYYFGFTDSGKATMERSRQRKAAKREKPLSQVGVKGAPGTGGLACPKCGGTQFKAGRKTSTKLAFGAASMLGQAKHVRCVTCGTRYLRG